MPTTYRDDRCAGRPSARVQSTIYLRPHQAEGLRELADARECPMSQLIRQAVDRFLATERPE